MKIATITYSWAQNWGAVLQAYALVEYLNSMGHDAKLIDYRQFDNRLISTVKSVGDGVLDLLMLPVSKKRIERYNEFRKNAFRLTSKCCTTDDLKRLNDDFDVFVTGSDQVWNVGHGVCKDFYLHFVNDNKKKISYAASFGVSSIPQEHQQDTIKGINNIDAISVREKSGQQIIKDLTGRDSLNVLDPVFLLDKKQWEDVSRSSGVTQKYIFVYPTQVTPRLKFVVKKIKKETGLCAISPFYIPGCKTVKDIGPREFIDYIANAEYVVASSFHATAFSIIFNKRLFVITHSETGSRTSDLLKMFDMEDSIITDVEKTNSIVWDYVAINLKKEKLIKKSKDFLSKALS